MTCCGGEPSRPTVRLRDLSSNGTGMFAKPMSTFLLMLRALDRYGAIQEPCCLRGKGRLPAPTAAQSALAYDFSVS